ncbi:MAG: hypothetical protein LRY66_17195 [Saccharospirillaceae bacterium]|nr:hypothetical protein [Saccharospirillaceae bacterium]MCD8533039.1 hypothetical protein [Saccharospirillaceae bacterium]
MNHSVLSTIIFLLGAAAGFSAAWIFSYRAEPPLAEQQPLLESVMRYANTEIAAENDACEGSPVTTVGAVIASLLAMNNTTSRNRLTYGCYNEVCTLSVSSCKPWQDQECSTRFLKFERDNQQQILPASFSCLDMP